MTPGPKLHTLLSENSGTPKSSHFNRVFHYYKPSILGVFPLFLETPMKHPYPLTKLECFDLRPLRSFLPRRPAQVRDTRGGGMKKSSTWGTFGTTVGGRKIYQLRLVVYPIIYRGFTYPRWFSRGISLHHPP